jgi:hypothetical protein
MRSVLVALLLAAGSARAETLAEQLLAGYDRVTSVTCEIRRNTESSAGSARMLSRICYQKPDRLNVENVAPLPRRIVADGTNFYSYIDGDPKGFSRSISRLDEKMEIELRRVPGTAMEHLLRLRGATETDLEASPEFPVRKGYDRGKAFTVLSLDATGRLARVELFESPAMKERKAQYDYAAFREVVAGVWIPCLRRAVWTAGGDRVHETVRVDNLSVNTPIAPGLFDPAAFFKGVRFADSFDAVYE